MEVHHHPDLQHKKKNFKEYFLEFLMIFLAVTLGFIAENLRERISDKEQVQRYMQSMVDNLKSDGEMYRSYDSMSVSYCTTIDSIFTFLNNNSKSTGQIYYRARTLTNLGSFIPSVHSSSYSQMTSTGAIRLIKHQPLADSIASYYQLIKSFDDWTGIQRQRVDNLIAVNNKLFRAGVFFSMYKAMQSSGDSLQNIIKSNPAFEATDEQSINMVMMEYQYYYGFLKLMIQRTNQAWAQANNLAALLKKEYNIKG